MYVREPHTRRSNLSNSWWWQQPSLSLTHSAAAVSSLPEENKSVTAPLHRYHAYVYTHQRAFFSFSPRVAADESACMQGPKRQGFFFFSFSSVKVSLVRIRTPYERKLSHFFLSYQMSSTPSAGHFSWSYESLLNKYTMVTNAISIVLEFLIR